MHGLSMILFIFCNADLLKSVSDYYKRVCYNTVTILAFDMGGANNIGKTRQTPKPAYSVRPSLVGK